MSEHARTKARTTDSKSSTAARSFLRRKCACGQHVVGGGECAACRKQRLQRRPTGSRQETGAPPIVHDVLRSPGQRLDAATGADMAARFGRDFSGVRVHTGRQAAASARAVGAEAYTVNQQIVFGAGRYAPGTKAGRALLAHELAHTVQQRGSSAPAAGRLPVAPCNDQHERQAEQAAASADHAQGMSRSVAQAGPSVQRACGSAAVGSVAGCTGLGGQDVYELGVNSKSLYFFNINCDEFLDGEEARLRSYAATITPDKTVEVHGFASEEGDETFNDNLSCARARAAAYVLSDEGVAVAPTIYKHGATPGARPDHRSVVIVVREPAPEPEEEEPAPAPSPTYVACYDGSHVYVNKNGRAHHCAAVTGTVGLPTPDGEYCIREQGAAQRGWRPWRGSHSDWFLLEPQFTTTRSRMHLHPGSASAGCVTVTDDSCFGRVASILNSSGRITRDGYEGYPPGNSDGVTNPKAAKTCVGLLLVSRRRGGCNFMTGASPSP